MSYPHGCRQVSSGANWLYYMQETVRHRVDLIHYGQPAGLCESWRFGLTEPRTDIRSVTKSTPNVCNARDWGIYAKATNFRDHTLWEHAHDRWRGVRLIEICLP